MQRGFSNLLILFAGIAVIAVVGFYAFAVQEAHAPGAPGTPGGDGQVACTADAMQCPDGSWVGRTGPNCEFICPTPTTGGPTSATVSVHLGQTVSALGVDITPLSILEDSRCPVDVQCIQAGTVRLLAKVGQSQMEFRLAGQAITTETESITLTNVTPVPHSGVVISPSAYVFTFVVTKRTATQSSGIRGTITAGPTCPVESYPPNPACADRPVETNVSVFRASDLAHGVAFTTSDAQGTFQVSLPPGDYVIMSGPNGVPFPRCPDAAATVGTGYTQVSISCDTGIR